MLTSDRDESPAGGRGLLDIGGRTFSSLRTYPDFRRLWISNLFFFGGVWTHTLILGWLVFDMTGSEFLTGVFTAGRLAPMMLGPISGVISDRFNRVKLLLGASVWAFAAIIMIAVLVATGQASFWAVFVGGVCIGLAQSPSQPARFALVFDFVGRKNLNNANALNSIVTNMTQVLGPALGGAMIAVFGVSTSLWVSSFWYVISFLALWKLRDSGKPAPRVEREPIMQMLSAGLRAVFSSQLATAVLLVTFAANILLWPMYQGFMPVFAEVSLGLDADGLGWLMTCSGLGGLVGSLTIATLGDVRFKGALFVFGTGVWAVSWILFAGAAMNGSLPWSFALMGLVGLASAPFGVLQSTLLLMMTERGVQGRVMGIQELAIGVMPLSTLVLGLAAELVGVAAVAQINGVLLVLFLVVLGARVPALLRYSGIQPQS
ncbi:MFS transporter [Paeniglutamicibacter antarcticus]|uniref:MFS transporter n=1 Tax=Paeniglutamicibacter antarcticus TaxID=494023 RepID=A0ABP9TTG4_9MICC